MGPFATALAPDEILTEIRIPARSRQRRRLPEDGAQGRRLSPPRRWPCSSRWTPTAPCEHAGIGLTNVGLMPIRATQAEAALIGKRPDDAAHQRAAQLAGGRSAARRAICAAPVEYKRDAWSRTLTGRALRASLSSAPATRGDAMSTHTRQRDGQRREARGGGRAAAAAGPLHPREPEPDRHPHRLRHDQLRRLHGAARRHGRSSPARCSPSRPTAREITTVEGLAQNGKLHPIQEGFFAEARPAVRLLHARA